MEPLKPTFREALKEAHPGLSDEVIDRAEELLAQRFRIDPDLEPQRIRKLDRQRAALLQKEMPNYEKVLRIASDQENR
ncbi:MAG: hypothetical protein LH606_04815 [Cytophagaceae bacterium]|nr:hypothetical protein [Cytophagaceae bacterium]